VTHYRSPHQHAGERVVVVGAGNSAVQAGYELAQVATVTLATRHPVTFHPQCRGGRDLHHWLVTSGLDLFPPRWLDHYLGPLGALDTKGMPLHAGGISATHPGLVYLGLEFQRSFSSNTLRGVHRDAEHVVTPLAAHVRNAPAAVGL